MILLIGTFLAWSNPSLVFVERNKDFHIYHPISSSNGTMRFSFADMPYISMEMEPAHSLIYSGDSVYESIPNEIYVETNEKGGIGTSELIPLEIIPLPIKMMSLGGENPLPLPEPTKLNLVKLEIQQYKAKQQIAKAHREQRMDVQKNAILLEEEYDGVVSAEE